MNTIDRLEVRCGGTPDRSSASLDGPVPIRTWSVWLLLLAGLGPAYTALADVRLNEVVSLNRYGLTDEEEDHPDWIELSNSGTTAVSLAGWSLSDDPKNPRKWTFLRGELPPASFLTVFASGKDRQPAAGRRAPFHTSFRLDADGETVVLTSPAGAIVDQTRVPSLLHDLAWGRKPDGSGVWRFFATPTPGAPNQTPSGSALLAAPTFSRPAGFYTNAFDLVLQTAETGAAIRYTLDGSVPTEDSPRYAAPLTLTNRANVPNRLSLIPSVPGWPGPVGRVFKGTVVRARAFRTDALPSPTTTATYFIHPRGREKYSLPVVTLSTDERNFFDPTNGIYVPGVAPGGNYSQAGDDWERPVHVEFLETDGSLAFSQESGVRIHGNTSFNFPVKALRLHPLNQDGTGPFRHRIFPDLPIDSFDRLLLRPSGHDYYLTMMRDGLQQALVRELGLDLQGYRPAILFLNGEYWGIHNLQEAFEKNYFAAHHPEVDPEAVDYLEGYPPGVFAYSGDATVLDELYARLPDLPIESATGFDWVRARMDVDNFRDYKLAEIFDYRWDIGNHRLWRPRVPGGRLRWILFDCDVGFGGFWSEPDPWTFDMLHAVLEPSGSLNGHNNATTVLLLRRLLANDAFRVNFVTRAADLLNTTFATPRVVSFIDRMAAEIAPEMVEHVVRWREPASYNDWTHHVEALRTFARERPARLREHFLAQFKLRGVVTLRVRTAEPGTSAIRVNTLPAVTAPDGGTWSGVYFRGVPIHLEASPLPGWQFAGWEGLPGVTNRSLTLTLTTDFTASPRFVRPELRLIGVESTAPGAVTLLLAGPPGAEVIVEGSTDLVVWETTTRMTLPPEGLGSSRQIADPTSRFFRARLAR